MTAKTLFIICAIVLALLAALAFGAVLHWTIATGLALTAGALVAFFISLLVP
jgi:uncharacterized membrane protein YdjX (TVP38/TMEM64 family)